MKKLANALTAFRLLAFNVAHFTPQFIWWRTREAFFLLWAHKKLTKTTFRTLKKKKSFVYAASLKS